MRRFFGSLDFEPKMDTAISFAEKKKQMVSEQTNAFYFVYHTHQLVNNICYDTCCAWKENTAKSSA